MAPSLIVLALFGVIMVGLLGVAVWLLWTAPAPVVTVQAPTPIVIPAPTVEVVASHRQRTGTPIRIRLMDGSLLSELGTYVTAEHLRPQSLTARTTDGLIAQFVASHKDPNGEWIYRCVGIEPEETRH